MQITTCLLGWGLFTDRPLSHPAGLKQLAINSAPVELQAPPIGRLVKPCRRVDPAHAQQQSVSLPACDPALQISRIYTAVANQPPC